MARLLFSEVCSIEMQPAINGVTEWPFSRFITRLYGFDTKFKTQRCQKYASHEKKLQIKVVRNWISYKKVRERMCLSPPRVQLGGLKDWHVWSTVYREMANYIQFRAQPCQKYASHTKKASDKSYSELNFIQKCPQRICLFPSSTPSLSRARGLQRLILLKYNVLK